MPACRELWSWPGLVTLRGMHHRGFRLESMAPGHCVPFGPQETEALPQAMGHSDYP